jgi:EpsI family protein
MISAKYRHILLASFVILAAAVLAHFLTPHQLMAKTSASLNLDAVIPKQFGQWTLMPDMSPVTPEEPEGYVETDTKTNRIYSQEVGRTYTDGHGRIVMLMVAYGPAQTFRLKAHRPEMCYTAAGFRISEKTYSSIALNPTLGATARPLNVARIVAEREARLEPISYWMRVGHDITTGVVDRQLIRLKYGLKGLIPDGALMRVSTIGLPREQSFEVQDEFIRDLLAAIAPQNRWFFIGA